MASASGSNKSSLDAFTLIWLDAEINMRDNIETQKELRQLNDDFHIFDNPTDFHPFVRSLSIAQHCILVISGRLGREVVPIIHDVKEISSIYIYCFNRDPNVEWSKDYSKVKDVITNRDDLIKKIRQNNEKEIYQIENDALKINFYADESNNQFIHTQLLINYVLKTKSNSMIVSLPAAFNNEPDSVDVDSDLLSLEEFQKNNRPDKSMECLLKSTYLNNKLSEAFYTKNINSLYLLRPYVCNIHQELERNKCSTLVNAYYGCLLTSEDFERLKESVGKLISINSFLIATFQRELVLEALQQINQSQKILFNIVADPSIDGAKPFADIRSFNSSTNRAKILFMLGSIFIVDKLFQNDRIWECQLKLSSENHPCLKTIFQERISEIGNSESDCITFGNVLAHIGQYDDATRYYKYLLDALPPDHQDNFIIYRNLGNVAFLKNDYDESLNHHLRSIKIQEHQPTNDATQLAKSYNCLGNVYCNQNKWDQAISAHEKVLHLLESVPTVNHGKVTICLNNISYVHRMKKQYAQALDYYKRILDIQTSLLPPNPSDLGETYHNIGALYWCCGSYDMAMKSYDQSLTMKKSCLRADHESIAMTLENIGLVHENNNNCEEALKYYQEAVKIYRQTPPPTNCHVVQIENSIKRVLDHIR